MQNKLLNCLLGLERVGAGAGVRGAGPLPFAWVVVKLDAPSIHSFIYHRASKNGSLLACQALNSTRVYQTNFWCVLCAGKSQVSCC